MQQLVNVKCHLIGNTPGHYMVSYLNPLSERSVRARFTSKDEAFRYKEDIEKKFAKNDSTLIQGLKISNYIQLYTEKCQKNHFVRMRKIFKDFYDTFSEFKPEEITTDIIEVWFKQLKEENNYADATMFRIRTTTHTFFLFLIREGIIHHSPVPSMQFDPYQFPSKRKRNLLSEQDLDEILKEAQCISLDHAYPVLATLIETAARTTEVLDLKWDDIDLHGGYIHFKAHPRTHSRIVKISSGLRSFFEKKKKASNWVFTCPYNEPMNKNKFARVLMNFKRECNVKKLWNPWDFRYSFAYHFLQKGGSIDGLQNILGHHSPKETRRRYEHFLPKMEKSAT